MKKETWQKPKLVILVRTNPEETVLSSVQDARDLRGPGSQCRAAHGELRLLVGDGVQRV